MPISAISIFILFPPYHHSMDIFNQLHSMLFSLWSRAKTAQGALFLLFALFLVYAGSSGILSLDSLNAFLNSTSLGAGPTGAVILAPLNGNASSQGNQSSGGQGSNVSSGNGTTALLSGPADLAVTSISYSPAGPVEGDTVSITAKISNLGDASAALDNVSVSLAISGFAASQSINLTGRPEADVAFTWTAVKGLHDILVSADPLAIISDEDRANNRMVKSINVSGRNRPPLLQPLSPLSVNAGDRAIITANASDPDNDTLTYSINDSRFTQSGSTFTWRTYNADEGVHRVLVSVSDGRFTDTTGVNITVNPSGGGGYMPQVVLPVTTVDGYVTDLTPSFISGANVTVLCLSNSNSFSALTDTSGRYSGMFECPFSTMINVSAAKNNFTGYNSNTSDASGHAAIDIVIPFSSVEIPEFPSAAIPALLSMLSFGLVRLRKR